MKRYSLLTIFLVAATAALSIRLIQISRDVSELRTDHQRLWNLAGDFTVDDPGKLHVRRLACDGPLTWRFKVFTPGKQFFIQTVPIVDGTPRLTKAVVRKIRFGGTCWLTLNIAPSKEGTVDFRVYVTSSRSGITSGGFVNANVDVRKLWYSHDPHSELVGQMLSGKEQLHGELIVSEIDAPFRLARVLENEGDSDSGGIEFWLYCNKPPASVGK